MINNKFIAQCWIGNQVRAMSEHHLSFSDNSPGRAKLTIKGTASPNQIIALELGWGDSVHRCFTGYIERVSPNANGYSTVFCRELLAILYNPVNITLRHPTLLQILSNITEQTGVQFVVPDVAYSKTAIACFYSTGNGYRALDELGKAFNIKNFTWQQQGNGQTFVGSWNDSRWATRPVEIPNELMTPMPSPKSYTLPCMPMLKPSVVVNGAQLTSVSHSGTQSIIEWT